MKHLASAVTLCAFFAATAANAQDLGEVGTWSISGESAFRGETSISSGTLRGHYQIGGAGSQRVGFVKFENVSGESRTLRIIGIEPGYDSSNPRDWWFSTGGGHNGGSDPGAIVSIGVNFVGHVGGSTVWVDEGTYDAVLTVLDERDGSRFEVPVSAVAFRVGE